MSHELIQKNIFITRINLFLNGNEYFNAYATVAACARNRHWILAPRRWQLILFVMIGVSVTAAIEWLATRGHWVTSWTYLPAMPLPPGTGIGLMPLAQWLVLPLLTVWYVQRQLTVSAPKR